ncbi:MAG TPA: hypothetical protein PKN34_14715, partial [Azospira sp.]|nr:hypothetical protein [Azospira sp.]
PARLLRRSNDIIVLFLYGFVNLHDLYANQIFAKQHFFSRPAHLARASAGVCHANMAPRLASHAARFSVAFLPTHSIPEYFPFIPPFHPVPKRLFSR